MFLSSTFSQKLTFSCLLTDFMFSCYKKKYLQIGEKEKNTVDPGSMAGTLLASNLPLQSLSEKKHDNR